MSHALYEVTVKLQLMDGDKLLVLTSPDGCIDFPGGRVDDSEQELSMEQALAREISEELGEALSYDIVDTAFVAHRAYEHQEQTHHVLAVRFRAKLTGGTVRLSDEHTKYRWVEPISLLSQQDRFVSSDEHRRFAEYYA
jgi:8-oxo-dGTP pyrophosphatase MutT (NUDIX family)